MRSTLSCLALLALVAPAALLADESAEKGPAHAPYLKMLADAGFDSSGAGAVKYLEQLHPSADHQAKVAKLIRQLGAPRWADREAASRALSRMPNLPAKALAAAADSDDREIAWRARRILELWGGKSSQVIYAALKTIQAERTEGATAPLLAALPLCREAHLLTACLDALRAAARATDLGRLREALGSEVDRVRLGAAAALCVVTPEAERETLAPLMKDASDPVALEVARALADGGDRRCLAALLRLLDSRTLAVRSGAVRVLRGLTGQLMKFAAYRSADARRPAVERWRAWIAGAGKTAKLTFPVPKRHGARGELHGRTLVSTGQLNKIMELDASGKEVWSYPLSAWSAEKLISGNVLIASYSTNQVVEVDAAKKVVWKFPNLNAMTAKPLLNGNILVSDFRGKRVVEINRQKKIVWETKCPQECFDADRLPNGNTIFGCPNWVKEVTPDHKVVREWKIEGRLNGFQALPSGNVLVANYGKSEVVELTPDGKRVWVLKESQPCDVFRLPNGNTLVSSYKRIVEVGPDKKVVKEICKAKYGSARR